MRDQLDMFAVLRGGAEALLPVYATDIWLAGPNVSVVSGAKDVARAVTRR